MPLLHQQVGWRFRQEMRGWLHKCWLAQAMSVGRGPFQIIFCHASQSCHRSASALLCRVHTLLPGAVQGNWVNMYGFCFKMCSSGFVSTDPHWQPASSPAESINLTLSGFCAFKEVGTLWKTTKGKKGREFCWLVIRLWDKNWCFFSPHWTRHKWY